jgi:competence ComEA-like helix-hairpin-helix protein
MKGRKETITMKRTSIYTALFLLAVIALATDTHAGVGPARAAIPVVNINTATPEQLAFLPGVGPVIAQRIVAARESSVGPFKSADDLLNVKGIGAKKLAAMKPHVVTSGATTATEKIKVEKVKE